MYIVDCIICFECLVIKLCLCVGGGGEGGRSTCRSAMLSFRPLKSSLTDIISYLTRFSSMSLRCLSSS